MCIHAPVYIYCPQAPALAPGRCWTELVRLPAPWGRWYLEPPLNLPSTKKLKYFNIFFFLVPEFIPWVLGLHCVTYIYITVYIYIYIYIIFFWLGLFLIQSYRMVASPSPKGCPISVLEHGIEGAVCIFMCGGLKDTE